jgi:hypothetical protein
MNEQKDGFSKFFSKLSSNSTHPESAPLFDEEPPDSSPLHTALPLAAAHEDQSSHISVGQDQDEPFEEAVPLEDELADLLDSID